MVFEGIELKNIRKSYGKEEILRGVDLSVRKGEILAVLGVSGAGKTTLLRIIAGLEVPEEGKVFLDGRCVTEGKRIIVPPRFRKVGFIFQNLGLWQHMSVEEHLKFVLRLRKSENPREEARELLRFFGLWEHRRKRPHQLSGGEKQRLAFARALAQQVSFLLLDEPLSNLDLPRKKQLRGELLRLKSLKELTMLYVTHDPIDVELISDRVAVLHDGRIIQQGTYQELLRAPAYPIVRELLSP